jgi:hypothetical protein
MDMTQRKRAGAGDHHFRGAAGAMLPRATPPPLQVDRAGDAFDSRNPQTSSRQFNGWCA